MKKNIFVLIIFLVLLVSCNKKQQSHTDLPESFIEISQTEKSSEFVTDSHISEEYYSIFDRVKVGETQFSVLIRNNPIDTCTHIPGELGGITKDILEYENFTYEMWKLEMENVYDLMLNLEFLSPDYINNLKNNQDYYIQYTTTNRILHEDTKGGEFSYGIMGKIEDFSTRTYDYKSRTIELIDIYMYLTQDDYIFVYHCDECN